jgi:hypothetical protein
MSETPVFQDVVDLDEFVPSAKRVKFGGDIYEVPDDLPMELFLRINKAGQLEDEGDETSAMKELADSLVKLLTWELPMESSGAIREKVEAEVGRRGVSTIMKMLRAIYRQPDAPTPGEPTVGEAEADAVPPSVATTGNASTTSSPVEPATEASASSPS